MSDTSCKHPLKAFQIGLTDKGKPKYKICSYGIDYVSVKLADNSIVACSTGEPVRVPGWRNVTEFLEIPCGHCLSCRLKYSKDWANRMLLEAKEHENNYFLTLTYNDKYLPDCLELDDPQVDTETGEIIYMSPVHPLVKSDIQKFMKRLRKRFPDDKIRFYACGEYGPQNMRPHYHLILFGLNLPENDLYIPEHCASRNFLDQKYFCSKIIDDCWCDPISREVFGYHILAPVTWETCAYTARYVTKKLNGEQLEQYTQWNYPREFALMSRKPGIARNYYDEHMVDIYRNDEMFLNLGDKGGKKIKPPKYYDRLYDIDYPEDMSRIKGIRKELAEANQRMKMSLTTLSYEEQLVVEEENLKARTKILQRKDF